MNDLDSSRICCLPGNNSVGFEVQETVYGYTHPSLSNVLFKKYLIKNNSLNTIDSMFFGYWSNPDIGNLYDDYAGCDTLLNLAYCYNADNDDEGYYEENPPALGYMLLQGPHIKTSEIDSALFQYRWIKGYKNQKLTAFNLYNTDLYWQCDPVILNADYYSFFNGKTFEPYCHHYLIDIINPLDGIPTNIMCPGDPVSGTGWYEGDGWPNGLGPGDKKILIGSGPITMAPGDTQEVAIAIIAARGSDNLQSIVELRKTAKTVQDFYNNYIPETVNIKYVPPLPEYYYLGQNYPNPFNPITTIKYDLPVNGFVTLKVFDILGREISTLLNEEKKAGTFQIDFSSNGLSSGIYFYTLTSHNYSKTKKMVVIR
jgi:hypothetical protein